MVTMVTASDRIEKDAIPMFVDPDGEPTVELPFDEKRIGLKIHRREQLQSLLFRIVTEIANTGKLLFVMKSNILVASAEIMPRLGRLIRIEKKIRERL